MRALSDFDHVADHVLVAVGSVEPWTLVFGSLPLAQVLEDVHFGSHLPSTNAVLECLLCQACVLTYELAAQRFEFFAMVIWQEHVLVCDDLVEAAEQFTQSFTPLIVKAAAVKPLSDVVRVHGPRPGARRLCFQLWPFGGRADALDGQFALEGATCLSW